MNPRRALLAAILWCLAVAPLAGAEDGEEGDFQGWLSGGGQAVRGEEDSSKFEEYRDLPEGLVLPSFELRYLTPSRKAFWELGGVDAAQQDQRITFRSGAPGVWDLQLLWDRTPHRTSDDSLLIYDRVGPGEYRLPAEVQLELSRLAGNPEGAYDRLLELADPFGLRQRQDTYGLSFGWKPVPGWDFRFRLEREEQTGTKPFGGMITFFNSNEVPEPVDYATNRFETSGEWTNRRAFASFRFGLSHFDNGLDRLVWDQPFVAETAGRAYQGQAGLAPDNRAQDLSVSGGLSWGRSQRLVATLSRGSWTQDQPFLPYTINPAFDVYAPPQPSLNGRIDTTLADVRYSARPLRRLGVEGWIRGQRHDNDTPYLILDHGIIGDSAEDEDPHGNLAVGYRRANAGVELDWDVARRISVGAGYEIEDWDHDYREAEETRERVASLSFRAAPSEKIAVRLRGETGRRRYDAYDAARVLQTFYPGADPADLQKVASPDLRKFDVANRDRDEAELMLQWTPLTEVSLSTSWRYRTNDYPDSGLGLLQDSSQGVALDVAWSPSTRVQLYANWARDAYRWDQRNRYRPSEDDEDPLDEWSSSDDDRSTVWGAGAKANLWKDRLDLDVRWSRSDSEGKLRNAFVPGGSPEADDLADFPDFTNDLQRIDSTLRLLLQKGWEVSAEYAHEKRTAENFKLDPMQVYMAWDPVSGQPLDSSAGRSNFLAARVPDYSADVVSVLVGYRW